MTKNKLALFPLSIIFVYLSACGNIAPTPTPASTATAMIGSPTTITDIAPSDTPTCTPTSIVVYPESEWWKNYNPITWRFVHQSQGQWIYNQPNGKIIGLLPYGEPVVLNGDVREVSRSITRYDDAFLSDYMSGTHTFSINNNIYRYDPNADYPNSGNDLYPTPVIPPAALMDSIYFYSAPWRVKHHEVNQKSSVTEAWAEVTIPNPENGSHKDIGWILYEDPQFGGDYLSNIKGGDLHLHTLPQYMCQDDSDDAWLKGFTAEMRQIENSPNAIYRMDTDAIGWDGPRWEARPLAEAVPGPHPETTAHIKLLELVSTGYLRKAIIPTSKGNVYADIIQMKMIWYKATKPIDLNVVYGAQLPSGMYYSFIACPLPNVAYTDVHAGELLANCNEINPLDLEGTPYPLGLYTIYNDYIDNGSAVSLQMLRRGDLYELVSYFRPFFNSGGPVNPFAGLDLKKCIAMPSEGGAEICALAKEMEEKYHGYESILAGVQPDINYYTLGWHVNPAWGTEYIFSYPGVEGGGGGEYSFMAKTCQPIQSEKNYFPYQEPWKNILNHS
jgi:hypothetical protein